MRALTSREVRSICRAYQQSAEGGEQVALRHGISWYQCQRVLAQNGVAIRGRGRIAGVKSKVGKIPLSKYRTILRLRDRCNLTVGEIAAMYGCSRGTVHRVLTLARAEDIP